MHKPEASGGERDGHDVAGAVAAREEARYSATLGHNRPPMWPMGPEKALERRDGGAEETRTTDHRREEDRKEQEAPRPPQ